jgi:hypothetical protein
MAVARTKGSINAGSGFLAERCLITQSNAIQAIEGYMAKKIVRSEKIKGNKKTDVKYLFEDGSYILVQNKNGKCDGTGRGHHLDRRPLEGYSETPPLFQTLGCVCLGRGDHRYQRGVPREGDKELTKDMSIKLLDDRLFGSEEATKPTHFTNTTLKDGLIATLSIAPAADVWAKLISGLHDTMQSKKTVVYLSEQVSLHRKGATEENKPDDIQMKLRLDASGFTNLPLA